MAHSSYPYTAKMFKQHAKDKHHTKTLLMERGVHVSTLFYYNRQFTTSSVVALLFLVQRGGSTDALGSTATLARRRPTCNYTHNDILFWNHQARLTNVFQGHLCHNLINKHSQSTCQVTALRQSIGFKRIFTFIKRKDVWLKTAT